jgi:hypothetical protein
MNERVAMRRAASGHFELDLPAHKAIALFTPEGERDWVPGWNPTYPTGNASETPGTVFISAHGSVETIWLIHTIDIHECQVSYSRFTPGHHAGTVRVSCDDTPRGGAVVSVTYDMSLLPGSDPSGLDPYDDHQFEAMLADWAQAIAHNL